MKRTRDHMRLLQLLPPQSLHHLHQALDFVDELKYRFRGTPETYRFIFHSVKKLAHSKVKLVTDDGLGLFQQDFTEEETPAVRGICDLPELEDIPWAVEQILNGEDDLIEQFNSYLQGNPGFVPISENELIAGNLNNEQDLESPAIPQIQGGELGLEDENISKILDSILQKQDKLPSNYGESLLSIDQKKSDIEVLMDQRADEIEGGKSTSNGEQLRIVPPEAEEEELPEAVNTLKLKENLMCATRYVEERIEEKGYDEEEEEEERMRRMAYLRCVKELYGDRCQKILEMGEADPEQMLPMMRRRMHQKLAELETHRWKRDDMIWEKEEAAKSSESEPVEESQPLKRSRLQIWL